jgi:Protein of unknown function (DUF2442)
MTKIVRATYRNNFVIELEFSDAAVGDYDLAPLLARNTELTRPLMDPDYFKRFFLDLGALCWPNGFELSPEAIHQRLNQIGALHRASRVA